MRDLQARVEPAGPVPRDVYDDLVKGVAQMPDTEVPDAQGHAMFVALQQATQSDDAARAFVTKMRAAQMQARQTIALNNLKQIGQYLYQYLLETGLKSYPTNLDPLVASKFADDKLFIDPLSGQRIVYQQPPLANADRPETIIAYTPTDVDGREVLFGDGHVSHMSAREFETALAAQRPAAQQMTATSQITNALPSVMPVVHQPKPAPLKPEPTSANPAQATKDQPWINSLGMKFIPVKGTDVLFSIWDTRVQDFEAFVKATGYDATKDMYSSREDGWKQRGDTWKSPGFTQGPTHPVCGVSWEDAKGFCEWLTKKEMSEGRLQPGQSYRLPTDAEWSNAVGLGREEGSTPEEKSRKIEDVYPWGDQWPPPRGAGNYAGEESRAGAPSDWRVISGYTDAYPRTSPVGSFDANQFGLYDMGGNVWQWCEDLFRPSEQWRVLRGASWMYLIPQNLLSSGRNNGKHDIRNVYNGFRCVLVIGSSP